MNLNLEDIFARYEHLVKAADTAFTRVKEGHGGCVTCKEGCSDCCYALFDLSLVEAMYLNEKVREYARNLPSGDREKFLENASKLDRQVYRLKRRFHKDHQEGGQDESILDQAGRERLRCPLLDENDLCCIYEKRPITCRLYGIPLRIGEQSRTCSLSGFEPGEAYPTVFLDRIQDELYRLSEAVAERAESKYEGLAKVLVPVSMAILTEYDDEYLGVPKNEPAATSSQLPPGSKEWVIPGPKQGDSE